MKKLKINVSLKEAMAGMTFKQKLEHLWAYYNWVLVAVFFVIMMISLLVTIIANARIEYLFSGYLANVSITEEGTAYLTDDWREVLEGNSNNEQVILNSVTFQELVNSNNLADDYASAMKISLEISTGALDYVIVDQVALDYYKNQQVFTSLEVILTMQQLTELEDSFVYQLEDGVEQPIALDISETAFAKACLSAQGPIYLCFPGNAKHYGQCTDFLDYLLNWKA